MAKVGAQRAAKLTGKSKSTIQRAMDAGKLSFEVAENGRRVIDVSELERVFGLEGAEASSDRKKPSAGMANVAELERSQLRVKSLEDQMFILNQQIEDVKGQRDSWQKQAQQLAITHQVTQDQASDAKKQAEEFKSKVDEAQKIATEAQAKAGAEKVRAEAALKDAERAQQELDELKQVAAKMKQRIMAQQQAPSRPAVPPPPPAKPKSLLSLLGFGGSKK